MKDSSCGVCSVMILSPYHSDGGVRRNGVYGIWDQ